MSGKPKKPINLICKEYSNDIEGYLRDKLPTMPPSTAQEISEYITCKTQNFMHDWQVEYERVQYRRNRRLYNSRNNEQE